MSILQEFQFQMAIRDQIISDQKNVIKNLWKVMEYSGLDKDAILEIARNEGALLRSRRWTGLWIRDKDGPILGDDGQNSFWRGVGVSHFAQRR